MEVRIEIKNIERIIYAFQKAPEEMGKGIQRALERVGVFVEGKTKEHITAGTDMWKAPIDTGAMRSGINTSFTPSQAVIRPSSSTPYAEYVHEGTKRMRARPFFEITAKNEEKRIEDMFNKELEDIVNRITSKT